ncbi:arginine N-succinyltransferase [Fretibacter rubidus]|uniref:arginine N-succinyltransferase n=1 Tax=Fretibacter rubidus TaxID=570162 RepID=UPI00352B2706
MLCVRPASAGDLPEIMQLATLAGPGFTSLAVGEDALAARLEKSVKSFAGPTDITPDHVYLLMLENADGEIVGMSAIKAQIGMRDPFFNFRILKQAQKSSVTDRRFDMDVLALVNDLTGSTEVGSLFVRADQRGPKGKSRGAGRLISQARYMLMAADKSRFASRVISELRGHVDDAGVSPFWDAIGRKFFDMDFNEADKISAEKDNQFILDLMPKHPIYAALLPESAQAVIGKTHPAGIGARRYLELEGFRNDGLIDIFDGGPSMTAPLDDIRTIRHSRVKTIAAGRVKPSDSPLTAMIARDTISDFRCVLAEVQFDGDDVITDPATLTRLNLKSGDKARIWIKR